MMLSFRATLAVAALSLTLASCASTTPTAPSSIPDAASLQRSANVTGRLSWVKEGVDFNKFTSIMIAPVTIYDGADTDWGNTSPADRTAIANHLETAYSRAIAQNMRVVNRPGPNTLLLRMQLVGVESNLPVASTASRVIPAGLVVNLVNQAAGQPGTFTGSVTTAFTLYDSTTNTLLAASVDKKFPQAFNITATFTTVAAAEAAIDQGAAGVGRTLQLLRSGQARTGS